MLILNLTRTPPLYYTCRCSLVTHESYIIKIIGAYTSTVHDSLPNYLMSCCLWNILYRHNFCS